MNTAPSIPQLVSRYRRCCLLVFWQIAACATLAMAFPASLLAANTVVRMEVSYDGKTGDIDLELYDDDAPKTVVNFLHYAGSDNAYTNNGFIYRHGEVSTSGVSVLQGGGWQHFNAYLNGLIYAGQIPREPPIPNEFSRSNVQGTIAMAKVAGDANSATSEWFINLADNNANNPTFNLDVENGGYTVFGHVVAGWNVVQDIANLPVKSLDMALSPIPGDTYNFAELPVSNSYNAAAGLKTTDLVTMTKIPNVASMKSPLGTWAAFTSDVDMTFSNKRSASLSGMKILLNEFTPPPHQTVQFDNGIFGFTLTGTMGASRTVTLFDGGIATPNRYYAYGPTSDNPTPHWYDFTYDGITGAEFVGNKILLHFVDGQRGDDDLDSTNNSITHTGAPVLVSDINTGSSSSVGCSIAGTPSPMRNGGDWIVVSMFLAFLALVRRRSRLDRTETTRH